MRCVSVATQGPRVAPAPANEHAALDLIAGYRIVPGMPVAPHPSGQESTFAPVRGLGTDVGPCGFLLRFGGALPGQQPAPILVAQKVASMCTAVLCSFELFSSPFSSDPPLRWTLKLTPIWLVVRFPHPTATVRPLSSPVLDLGFGHCRALKMFHCLATRM